MGTPRKTWVGSQSSFSCGLYYVSSKTKCVDQNFCLLISCFLQLNFLRRMTMFSVMMQRQLLQIFLIQLHSKHRKWSSLSLRSPDIVTEWDLEFGSELSLDSSPTLDLNESIDINSDIRILHYSTHTGTTRNLEWIRLSQITGLFGKFPPEFLDRAMRYFDD